MAIKKIPEHFSYSNVHPSVHDEESMTALELAGRLNGKVNECVDVVNGVSEEVKTRLAGIDEEIAERFDDQDDVIAEQARKVAAQMEEQIQTMIQHETETIPDTVDAEIRAFITSGQFDPAIREYLNHLDTRLANLEQSYFPGDTSANAELFDIRVGYNGYNGGTAGKTLRHLMGQMAYELDTLKDVTYHTSEGYPIFTTVSTGVGTNGLGLTFTGKMEYTSIYTSLIATKENEIFFYAGHSEFDSLGVIFYNNGTIVDGRTLGVNNTIVTVTIPENITHVQFLSFEGVSSGDVWLKVWRMSDIGTDANRAYDSEIYINSILNNFEIKEFDGYLSAINDTFLFEDDIATYHGKCTLKLPCKPGDRFKYRGVGKLNALSCVMFGAKEQIKHTYQYEGAATVDIPDNVYYVMFASFAEKKNPVILEVERVIDKPGIIANPLYNKEIAFNGDSIMAGDGFAGGFGKIIAERNHMNYTNIARGGATIATGTTNADGTARHHISATINGMSATADYIIINGGVNDAWNNVALGSFIEGYNGDGDTRTFYGAFDFMCKQLALGFWGKKVGYIFPHNCNSGLDTGKEYYNAAKRVLEKWGIPYLDLSTQLPPFGHTRSLPLIGMLQEVYIPDGVHPNESGYKYYYCDKIEAWLRTL